MAKEPKGRRGPSSRRKKGSSSSGSQPPRRSRKPRSPSVHWAKWIEALPEQHTGTEPAEPESHVDEIEAGRAERAQEATRRLHAATQIARQSRSGRGPEPPDQPAEAPVPISRAYRARRPRASDAPRMPATSETGIAIDVEPAASAGPTARPLIPDPTPATPVPAATITEPTTAAPEIAADATPEADDATAVAATVEIATDEHPAVQGPSATPPTADRAPRPVLIDPPLPDGYGADLIHLFARDPEWLFAYWEVTGPNWQRARSIFGDEADQARLVLRVYSYNPQDADGAESTYDIDIAGPARSWYVHAGRAEIGYEVELGLLGPGGQFVGLVRSNRTVTPRDSMSPVLDEEWRCLEREYQEFFALSGGYNVGTSSLELRELVTHRLQEIMGSGAVSSFGASEALVQRRGKRGFWFVLGTELIVYGATEPDATVTCQGQPIKLRPDGTFSLRFALPDGQQDIPCSARSADEIDTITITPSVNKWTQREEHSRDDPAFTAHAAPGDRESSDDPWRNK